MMSLNSLHTIKPVNGLSHASPVPQNGGCEMTGSTEKSLFFKNNLDTPGNTYGCHENYLMERHVDFRQLASQLIPFFVTRQVFAGAGKIKPSHRGYYAISQRAEHIREEISIGTTTARGIINTRDEPPRRSRKI